MYQVSVARRRESNRAYSLISLNERASRLAEQLKLIDRQAGYETEMPKIICDYSIAEFHGGYANQ